MADLAEFFDAIAARLEQDAELFGYGTVTRSSFESIAAFYRGQAAVRRRMSNARALSDGVLSLGRPE